MKRHAAMLVVTEQPLLGGVPLEAVDQLVQEPLVELALSRVCEPDAIRTGRRRRVASFTRMRVGTLRTPQFAPRTAPRKLSAVDGGLSGAQAPPG
jgi:hypothetical protein